MQTSFTLTLQEATITLAIKTTPFWRIYSEHLTAIKDSLASSKEPVTKWLLEQEVDSYVFDLLRLEL